MNTASGLEAWWARGRTRRSASAMMLGNELLMEPRNCHCPERSQITGTITISNGLVNYICMLTARHGACYHFAARSWMWEHEGALLDDNCAMSPTEANPGRCACTCEPFPHRD